MNTSLLSSIDARSRLAAGALGLLIALAPMVEARTLPAPAQSGIKHVVVVMMENRSYDHFLGWLPGSEGKQAGLTYLDAVGVPQPTYALATSPTTGDFQGCSGVDPDHSYEGGRVEYDNGACDGWLKPGANSTDTFSIGYYPQAALSFFGQAAPAWTVCDHYFSGILAETYPNRFHMHAAQTDRLHNSGSSNPTISTLPTIWDRLAAKGLSGRYYYSDVPFVALWGTKYLGISHSFAEFLADATAGRLPNVAFVDPRFLDEGSGTSTDDHPHADIRDGEAFLNQIYDAVRTSPNWSSTVLVINFDEWGGFFDHVPPPLAAIPPATAAAGLREIAPPMTVDGRLGFRVPNLVISPWSRPGVSNEQFDHTSILKMIEWRWGLSPLTVRDQQANNLADTLDFVSPPNPAPPQFTLPTRIQSTPCTAAPATSSEEFAVLRDIAAALGFSIF